VKIPVKYQQYDARKKRDTVVQTNKTGWKTKKTLIGEIFFFNVSLGVVVLLRFIFFLFFFFLSSFFSEILEDPYFPRITEMRDDPSKKDVLFIACFHHRRFE
jgi:hypothetical protein